MSRLFVVICILTCSLSVGADPSLGVDLKAGANTATLAADNRFNRYGFSGGVAGHLRWSLDSRFFVAGQMEMLYTPRGAEAIFDGVLAAKFRYHYFDVMIAARPGVQLSAMSIYLLLGGGVNRLLRANREDPSGETEDITDGLHRTDVAVLFGAGIALRLPRQKLGPLWLGTAFLEGRHDRGLIGTIPDESGFKNRTTSLMLGVSFALGGNAAGDPPTSPSTPSGLPDPAATAGPAE